MLFYHLLLEIFVKLFQKNHHKKSVLFAKNGLNLYEKIKIIGLKIAAEQILPPTKEGNFSLRTWILLPVQVYRKKYF